MKSTRRRSIVLRTDNISAVIYRNLGQRHYYLYCPQLRINSHRLEATNLATASSAAMKVLSARASWLARAWKKEINELTAETKRLTKELEQDAITAKR